MNGITTHVLDTSTGRPAPGIAVTLARRVDGEGWTEITAERTDADGRARLADGDASSGAGEYRLTFEVAGYFAGRATPSFYPRVVVHFEVRDAGEHHHVPLLLSPFGYSTYRGS